MFIIIPYKCWFLKKESHRNAYTYMYHALLHLNMCTQKGRKVYVTEEHTFFSLSFSFPLF